LKELSGKGKGSGQREEREGANGGIRKKWEGQRERGNLDTRSQMKDKECEDLLSNESSLYCLSLPNC
jgi:hypothetical protein